jgi:hypothetical protein
MCVCALHTCVKVTSITCLIIVAVNIYSSFSVKILIRGEHAESESLKSETLSPVDF